MEQAYVRAVRALNAAFANVSRLDALEPDGHAVNLRSNLLCAVSPQTQADFEAGAGRELAQKLRAPHSSAALVVNTFEPWRTNLEHLELAGFRFFRTIAFEKRCPTGLPGTPPHLDLVVEATETVVAVESKCTEYFKPQVPRFKPSYHTLAAKYGTRSWFRYVTNGAARPQHLDVAQLVKHWLGLCQAHPDQPVTLLYVYWEPKNWRAVPECRRHRDEIQEFAAGVAGDAVRFAAISYAELWAKWEQRVAAPWVTDHITSLRDRYAVAI